MNKLNILCLKKICDYLDNKSIIYLSNSCAAVHNKINKILCRDDILCRMFFENFHAGYPRVRHLNLTYNCPDIYLISNNIIETITAEESLLEIKYCSRLRLIRCENKCAFYIKNCRNLEVIKIINENIEDKFIDPVATNYNEKFDKYLESYYETDNHYLQYNIFYKINKCPLRYIDVPQNIVSLSIINTNLRNINNWHNLFPILRYLNLSFNKITYFKKLNLPRIEIINISHNKTKKNNFICGKHLRIFIK